MTKRLPVGKVHMINQQAAEIEELKAELAKVEDMVKRQAMDIEGIGTLRDELRAAKEDLAKAEVQITLMIEVGMGLDGEVGRERLALAEELKVLREENRRLQAARVIDLNLCRTAIEEAERAKGTVLIAEIVEYLQRGEQLRAESDDPATCGNCDEPGCHDEYACRGVSRDDF